MYVVGVPVYLTVSLPRGRGAAYTQGCKIKWNCSYPFTTVFRFPKLEQGEQGDDKRRRASNASLRAATACLQSSRTANPARIGSWGMRICRRNTDSDPYPRRYIATVARVDPVAPPLTTTARSAHSPGHDDTSLRGYAALIGSAPPPGGLSRRLPPTLARRHALIDRPDRSLR